MPLIPGTTGLCDPCSKGGAGQPAVRPRQRADFDVPRHWIVTFVLPDGTKGNSRTHFDVDGLRENIRKDGILQPLLVRVPEGAGSPEAWTEEDHPALELVAGERRWRAAEGVLDVVPCVLREMTLAQAVDICTIENAQRQDLRPSEEARTYAVWLSLRPEGGGRARTQAQLAKRIGASQAHVSNMVRLLTLPAAALALVDDGIVGHTQARDYFLPFVGQVAADAPFWEQAAAILRLAPGPWTNAALYQAVWAVASKAGVALPTSGGWAAQAQETEPSLSRATDAPAVPPPSAPVPVEPARAPHPVPDASGLSAADPAAAARPRPAASAAAGPPASPRSPERAAAAQKPVAAPKPVAAAAAPALGASPAPAVAVLAPLGATRRPIPAGAGIVGTLLAITGGRPCTLSVMTTAAGVVVTVSPRQDLLRAGERPFLLTASVDEVDSILVPRLDAHFTA